MTSEQLLADLAAAGFPVSSLTELRESERTYRAAVPALLAALDRTDAPNEREMIVRTLSKRWARDAVLDRFVEEFEAAPARWGTVGDNYAWALGNGIEIMAIDDDFDVLERLARDRRYRRAREMIVLGLGKSRRPEAVSTLLELVEDPDVDGHAILALAKIGSPRARSAFEAKLTDSRAWVRRAAARALRKLAPDD